MGFPLFAQAKSGNPFAKSKRGDKNVQYETNPGQKKVSYLIGRFMPLFS